MAAELPLAPIKRIIKRAGSERVSESAVEALRERTEEFTQDLAARARAFAQHAGRKTVKREDIRAAARE